MPAGRRGLSPSAGATGHSPVCASQALQEELAVDGERIQLPPKELLSQVFLLSRVDKDHEWAQAWLWSLHRSSVLSQGRALLSHHLFSLPCTC